ncbi:MAG: MFS transporter [Caldilineaceae bacterium]|nr:MFS transporter [Caldilineaceae bacterium]
MGTSTNEPLDETSSPPDIEAATADAMPARKWPWWVWFAPFLFALKMPRFSQHQWRILGLIGFASLFMRYDGAVLQLALPQIQNGLGIPDAALSNTVAIIEMGSIPAFFLMLAADRIGRRRLLLITIVGYTVLTGATAFVSTLTLFVIVQFLARVFLMAEVMLASVVIAEEFPPDARGRGIGALAAIAANGFGVAALLFAFVEVLPFGWRSLYVVGLIPLLILISLRRGLPETAHFQKQQAARAQLETSEEGFISNLQPLLDLVRAYPTRALAIGSIVFLYTVATSAAFFYDPTYLQQEHGWQPWHITMLTIGGGFGALFGNTIAGNVGDLLGRKRATVLFLVIMPILIACFYNAFGWLLPIIWAMMLFCQMGVGVSLETLGAELFPTSYRSTAAGARALVASSGTVVGLTMHGLLFGWLGSQWTAVTVLALIVFVTPFLVAWLPETSGRTLDEIAPEKLGNPAI